jgi:hypothetical protein
MRRMMGAILIAAALVGAGWLTTSPASAQTFRTFIDGWVFIDRLTISGDQSVAGTLSAGTLAVSGATTVNGDIATGGDMQTAGFIRAAANTAISVTQGMTITPTGSFHALTAAGNVSTGAIAAGSPGDILMLFVEDNVTITISDTGTLKLSGNLALGQYDSVTLLSDGTNWIQLATSNN